MPVFLLLPFILLLPVDSHVIATTAGDWQILVPRMPDGYGAGRIAVRVRTVALPEASVSALVDGLSARTGVAVTSAHGVRVEIVLPRDVQFESIRARVADGLVVQPEARGFVGRVGGALLSVLRIVLFGKLVAAADDLAIPGAAWAVALGAPDASDEMVRLTTADEFTVDRGQRAFSDHGDFVVCRAMFALTPWTELVEVDVRGIDLVSGDDVTFRIPRIRLDGLMRDVPTPAPLARTASVSAP